MSRVTRQLHGLTIHPPNSTHRRHKPSAGCSTPCVSAPETDEIAPARRKDLPYRSVTCIASSSAFVLRRRCARVEVAEGDVGSFSALGHGTARHEQTWKAERRSWVWLSGRRDPLRSTCRHGHGAGARERASQAHCCLPSVDSVPWTCTHRQKKKVWLFLIRELKQGYLKLDGPGYLRGSQS